MKQSVLAGDTKFLAKCPQDQTNVEWLNDYDGLSVPVTGKGTFICRYIDHKTTTRGSLVLDFESLNDSRRAVGFFNIKLISSRGNKYPAKWRGQFHPPIDGAFRRLWLQAVGKPPSRWSRVHKSMRSQLGTLVFSGKLEECRDRNGRAYLKLTDIKAL